MICGQIVVNRESWIVIKKKFISNNSLNFIESVWSLENDYNYDSRRNICNVIIVRYLVNTNKSYR